MPGGSYRKERLGRRRRDGRRSLAAATRGPEAGAPWLGLRGADDSGLGKRGQRGLLGLSPPGPWAPPGSFFCGQQEGAQPSCPLPHIPPGCRKRPWEGSCAERPQPWSGWPGSQPHLCTDRVTSGKSHISLNLFPLLSSEDHINLKQLSMKTVSSKGVVTRVIRVKWGVLAEEESSSGSPSLTPRCSCCTVPAPSSLGPRGLPSPPFPSHHPPPPPPRSR